MACPFQDCKSGNVRVAQPGIVEYDYYCNACKRTFTGFSPFAKKTALGLVGLVLLGPAGLLAGTLGGDDDASGGGGTDSFF